jgi:hypothetical protein
MAQSTRSRSVAARKHAENVDTASLYVPTDWVPITPGTPHAKLRALRANTAGTISVKTAGSDSSYRSLNFLAGETRYGIFIDVRVSGTSATGIEGGI